MASGYNNPRKQKYRAAERASAPKGRDACCDDNPRRAENWPPVDRNPKGGASAQMKSSPKAL